MHARSTVYPSTYGALGPRFPVQCWPHQKKSHLCSQQPFMFLATQRQRRIADQLDALQEGLPRVDGEWMQRGPLLEDTFACLRRAVASPVEFALGERGNCQLCVRQATRDIAL